MFLESHSSLDTEQFGRTLAKVLFPGLTVFLWGELGAGKTTMMNGVVSYFGHDYARSPSFTLVNEYDSRLPIAHVDLYRLEKCSMRDLCLDEYLDDGWVLFIEWPERLASLDEVEDFLNIKISMRESLEGPSSCRVIEVEAVGDQSEKALSSIKELLST